MSRTIDPKIFEPTIYHASQMKKSSLPTPKIKEPKKKDQEKSIRIVETVEAIVKEKNRGKKKEDSETKDSPRKERKGRKEAEGQQRERERERELARHGEADGTPPTHFLCGPQLCCFHGPRNETLPANNPTPGLDLRRWSSFNRRGSAGLSLSLSFSSSPRKRLDFHCHGFVSIVFGCVDRRNSSNKRRRERFSFVYIGRNLRERRSFAKGKRLRATPTYSISRDRPDIERSFEFRDAPLSSRKPFLWVPFAFICSSMIVFFF